MTSFKHLVAASGIAVLGLAVAAIAPAAEKKSAGAPASIDACSMLAPADVAAVTGFKLSKGVRHDEGITQDGAYSSTCMWQEASTGGGKRLAILNAMSWPKGSGKAGTFLQAFRDASAEGTIDRAPVPLKIGEESLWWGDGVAVKKGDLSFGISVFAKSIPVENRREMEESLAKQILKNQQVL